MTRFQAADKIRRNLNDAGVTYYSVSDLNESIQDAYDEIVVYSQCLDEEKEVSFVADYTYYDLSVLISNYYRLTRLAVPHLNIFLDVDSDRNEFSYRADWELTSSNPRSIILSGASRIGFVGRNILSGTSFFVNYKATAPVLSENTVLKINNDYLILVELYGTADMLDQAQEYIKAMKYWDQYEPLLEKYRMKIQNLAKSDRVFTRS